MARSKVRATYDDLLRLPEHVVGEIIDGELYKSPRPAAPHANAATAIGGELWGPFGGSSKGGPGPGGWWIVFEPELHFGADIVVPDLAGWRRERMPRMPNVAAFELAPDWVCEVVSPSTARLDRSRKMDVYARVQDGHLWIVDPLAQTLEIYRLDGASWVRVATHAEAVRVRAEPFAAIELDLSRWWLEPEPSP